MDQKEFEKQMGVVRTDIDAIDQKLLPLLVERMQCSERVAAIKQAAGKPVLDAKREEKILDGIRMKSGAYGAGAAAIYAGIMAVSRARQHQMLSAGEEIRSMVQQADRSINSSHARIHCQGVSGAYSHRAARQFFGERSFVFQESFEDVFAAIRDGEADFGVLPVENSSAGSVTDVYRLILNYRFYIVGAVGVTVSHCLASADGREEVRTVVSHPQGLRQCAGYIKKHGCKAQEFINTAAAAQYVAKKRPPHTAAICSVEAAKEYGLTILEEDIQDAKQNTTRFVVISRQPVLPQDAEKISLCFSLPHTTGSLYHILELFSVNGLNLTKIESRPIPERHFEYDFYLDFTGNIHDASTLDLICSLHDDLPRFSFLGNYMEI